MSQSSNVLIIGPQYSDFGADTVKNFSEAKSYLDTHKPSVIVFGNSRGDDFSLFCDFLLSNCPEALWILIDESLSPSTLMKCANFGKLYDLSNSFDDPELGTKLQNALESAGEISQKKQLTRMIEAQSEQLKKLSHELEQRVEKRHKTLKKSLKTLDQTKARLEVFHGALLGIHRANTVLQMEQTLNEVLVPTFNLGWIKIRFSSQSLLAQQKGPHILTVAISDTGFDGQVLFAKPEGKRFNPSEVEFLQEITDALALALSRLNALEGAEALKAQWQATFDSIPHPLCTTGKDYKILKLNRAFQLACRGKKFSALIGTNCFDAFFGNEFSPPVSWEPPFTFRNSRTGQHETEHFEISSEAIGLVLIRSITEEVRFERRIVAASKLAELGTIGSSIAHELNNPLGGMLSFLQLILMEIKKDDHLHADIKSMELAVLRCRDIVQNLLSFARKQDLGDFMETDLWSILERSIKLIELQSKSKGISIKFTPGPPALVKGNANALAQAFCNVLQNSIDAISDRLKKEPLFNGSVQIGIEIQKNHYVVRIVDNGIGIRPEHQSQIFNPLFTTRDPRTYSGMGLTTAFTIMNEHGGALEILSQTGSGTTAVFSFK